jgi:hypothetical protein
MAYGGGAAWGKMENEECRMKNVENGRMNGGE